MSGKQTSSSSSGGISFWGVVTIALIVLKLMGYIDWSWWWVLAPMWLGALVVLGLLLIAAVLAIVTWVLGRL